MFIPRQIKKLWVKILTRNKVTVSVNENNLDTSLPKYFSEEARVVQINSRFYGGWKLF
ncbi:MAG: hypothetical protein MJ219_00055 [Mycoplasmoidaceae bacterium]|nr:hypothetical protein [Mycoplasmoidaceae bacterium]